MNFYDNVYNFVMTTALKKAEKGFVTNKNISERNNHIKLARFW